MFWFIGNGVDNLNWNPKQYHPRKRGWPFSGVNRTSQAKNLVDVNGRHWFTQLVIVVKTTFPSHSYYRFHFYLHARLLRWLITACRHGFFRRTNAPRS